MQVYENIYSIYIILILFAYNSHGSFETKSESRACCATNAAIRRSSYVIIITSFDNYRSLPVTKLNAHFRSLPIIHSRNSREQLPDGVANAARPFPKTSIHVPHPFTRRTLSHYLLLIIVLKSLSPSAPYSPRWT